MSSATSIDDAVTPKTEIKKEAPGAFSPWHFFVLLSLVAASVAVVLAKQNSAENLLLISLTIGAAGAAGFALYRMLAPFATAEAEALGQPLSERLRADLEREKMLALRVDQGTRIRSGDGQGVGAGLRRDGVAAPRSGAGIHSAARRRPDVVPGGHRTRTAGAPR